MNSVTPMVGLRTSSAGDARAIATMSPSASASALASSVTSTVTIKPSASAGTMRQAKPQSHSIGSSQVHAIETPTHPPLEQLDASGQCGSDEKIRAEDRQEGKGSHAGLRAHQLRLKGHFRYRDQRRRRGAFHDL